MSNAERLYQLALTLTQGVGDVLIKNLIAYHGKASEVFKAPKKKLLKTPGIGPKVVEELVKPNALKEAENQLLKMEKAETSFLFYTDSLFPQKLRQIPDGPVLIFHKGEINFEYSKILAVVGTRNATEYGKEITRAIISDLSIYSPMILSGLAYGIDIEAHKAALENQLPTVAVFASGPDIIYPASHRKYVDKILMNGGILSEYPVGTKPEPHYFPTRNRIIAGWCDALVVVEAAAKGGALITARLANEYHKEVFAVPGPLNAKYSLGCNQLIRDHLAQIFTSVEDIEMALNWTNDGQVKKGDKQVDLEAEEKLIYDLLNGRPEGVAIDDLSILSGISLNKIAGVLLQMEIKNIIKALPGKKFKVSV